MDWLDAHSGSVQAIATLVLVILTGYYAWTSRSLVGENQRTLRATARSTLQARLDRLSEIAISNPGLFSGLDDDTVTGDEQDARFFMTNMFLGILEEAHVQFRLDRSMTADDWSAWVATADTFLPRAYVARYWERARRTYEPNFQRFVDERIAASGRAQN